MKLQWQDQIYRDKVSDSLSQHLSCHSDVRKKQLDIARTKRTLGPEWREKLRKRKITRRVPTKLTGIEIKLRDAFIKLKLDFVMHATLFERWQPDFLFEEGKLIVQADGDYWHAREEVRERDIRFNTIAAAKGWTIWRFSEQAINEDALRCAKAVAKFVRHSEPTLPLTFHVKTFS
jgi:very-short-patch-repair endonuclease